MNAVDTNVLVHAVDADETGGIISGAMFAFCQGTDPELFLLIEAQRGDDGERWMFAAAEFSNLSLFLTLDDVEVWSADPPRFSSRGVHVGGFVRDAVIPAE